MRIHRDSTRRKGQLKIRTRKGNTHRGLDSTHRLQQHTGRRLCKTRTCTGHYSTRKIRTHRARRCCCHSTHKIHFHKSRHSIHRDKLRLRRIHNRTMMVEGRTMLFLRAATAAATAAWRRDSCTRPRCIHHPVLPAHLVCTRMVTLVFVDPHHSR
jgi:hypothetical protein